MNTKRKQRYLYIDGEAIPVTEKVYRAFWHYDPDYDRTAKTVDLHHCFADYRSKFKKHVHTCR